MKSARAVKHKKVPRISHVIAAARRRDMHRRRKPTESQTAAILKAYAPVRQSSIYGELRKITLTLDSLTIAHLRAIGGGSVSDGARRLAREHAARSLPEGSLFGSKGG